MNASTIISFKFSHRIFSQDSHNVFQTGLN